MPISAEEKPTRASHVQVTVPWPKLQLDRLVLDGVPFPAPADARIFAAAQNHTDHFRNFMAENGGNRACVEEGFKL